MMTRRYGKAKTAYQRVLECSEIPEETKEKLKQRFLKLNPKEPLWEITRLGKKLAEK